MTALLDQALAKVSRLPSERQDELARMLLAAAASDASALSLTRAQAAEVEKRLESNDEIISMSAARTEAASWLE
jgi:hypothetical protein